MANLPYHARHTGTEVDDAVDRANILWDLSGNQVTGTFPIASGAIGGSINSLGLPFTPAQAFLQVESPIGGLALFAVIVKGTLLVDGFDFILSNATDNDGYDLHYLIVGEDADSNDSND